MGVKKHCFFTVKEVITSEKRSIVLKPLLFRGYMNGLRINYTGFERFKPLISVTSLPQESMVTDSCLGEL